MKLYFKAGLIIVILATLIGCGKDENDPRQSFQFYADKEKELNDREARLMLKERELEERERKIESGEYVPGQTDTSTIQTEINTYKDTSTVKPVKSETKQPKKKEIQKEMTEKFENPVTTVKDYFEYIKRGINEEGNFDANMKKAQKFFPGRSVDKLKSNYRKTKKFTVVEEPKVSKQEDGKSLVVTKVKQVELIDNKEVTKNLTVTYTLTPDKNGQWVISGASVKQK